MIRYNFPDKHSRYFCRKVKLHVTSRRYTPAASSPAPRKMPGMQKRKCLYKQAYTAAEGLPENRGSLPGLWSENKSGKQLRTRHEFCFHFCHFLHKCLVVPSCFPPFLQRQQHLLLCRYISPDGYPAATLVNATIADSFSLPGYSLS